MDWLINLARAPGDEGQFGVWDIEAGEGVKCLKDERLEVYATGNLYVDDQPLSLAAARELASGAVSVIDGAGFAVIADHEQRRLLVISDILGVCPAYRSQCGRYISSSADWVASRAGARVSPEAIAEFLLYGSLEAGATYYDVVERFPMATCLACSYSGEAVSETRYFRHDEIRTPAEPLDESAWRQRFFDGLRASIARLPDREICLLLSGGRDSRLVSSLLGDFNVHAVTFTDADGLEVEGAKKIARQHGFGFSVIQRDRDYYYRILPEAVMTTDGMFEYRHAYTLGLTEQIREVIGDRPVISGCFFDLMFKGLSSRGSERWYDKVSDLDGELFRQIKKRRRDRFEVLKNDLQRLERARCLPLAGLKTTAFRGTLLRSLNFVLLVSHRDLVRLFLEMPHQFKKDGFVRPEGQARAKEGAPRGLAGFKAFVNRHAPVLKQGAIKVGLRAPARHSSWVPIEEIAYSERARGLLRSYPEEIRFLEELLGCANLYNRAVSAPDPLFFRVATLAQWIRKNGLQARPDAWRAMPAGQTFPYP